MTNCCRKCAKLMCENRNKIENCKDCVSFLWLELKRLNKIMERGNEKYKN